MMDLFRHLRIHTATRPMQVKKTGTYIDKLKKVKEVKWESGTGEKEKKDHKSKR